MKLVLVKRVSEKEAEKGMIYLHPLKLGEFPKGEFSIKTSKGDEKTKILEVNCNCSDSAKEHSHHYLPLKNHKLNKGGVVQIKSVDGKLIVE